MERRALRTAELATRDREEALDLVQDAMIKLAERYGNRDTSEWGPLFHRILQSRIMDWHRRTKVRSRWRVWLTREDTARDDPLENRPDPADRRPERAVAGGRMTEALEIALAALAPRQREAFLLRQWDGLDVGATARAMGCSEGSVKTHYSRAVHALRDALADHY